MKKILLSLVALTLASPVMAQSIIVTGTEDSASTPLSVAFEELQAGENKAAVVKLTDGRVDARDPSRLINLGTAYARLGRTADAATAYRSAIESPIRYDLELANGDFMDSRWAARTALARLDQGRPLLALAH